MKFLQIPLPPTIELIFIAHADSKRRLSPLKSICLVVCLFVSFTHIHTQTHSIDHRTCVIWTNVTTTLPYLIMITALNGTDSNWIQMNSFSSVFSLSLYLAHTQTRDRDFRIPSSFKLFSFEGERMGTAEERELLWSSDRRSHCCKHHEATESSLSVHSIIAERTTKNANAMIAYNEVWMRRTSSFYVGRLRVCEFAVVAAIYQRQWPPITVQQRRKCAEPPDEAWDRP